MADGKITRTMSGRDWGLIGLLSLLWAGSFFCTSFSLRELPPATIVALRISLGALSLLVVVHLAGIALPREPRMWLAFALLGLLNNLAPFYLIVWAQSHITSGLASIINATTPVSTAIVAHLLTTDEKLSGRRLSGVLISLGGAALMIGLDALGSLGINILAQLACLAATWSYAYGGVYGRRFARLGLDPRAVAAGMLCMSALIAAPVALAVDRPWTLPMPSAKVWAAIAGLGVLATGLAYVLYFRVLASAGANNALLTTFLIPPGAILLGALFLDERLSAHQALGMVIIALGLLIIDGRVLSWLRGGRRLVE